MDTLTVLADIGNAATVAIARERAMSFVNTVRDMERKASLRAQLAGMSTVECVAKWAWNQQLIMDGYRTTAKTEKTGKGVGYSKR